MKHQPITAKQAKYTVIFCSFYAVMALLQLVLAFADGIDEGLDTVRIALWIFMLVLSLVGCGYTLWQRKHYPNEDPAADELIAENAKTGMKGMGIFFGIITVAFLLAILLAVLLKQ